VNEVQIPFKWRDAFDRVTIFGGKMRLVVCSLAYERGCILFNIGALQSVIAEKQDLDSDEGLKTAAKSLQVAAGIFKELKTLVMFTSNQEPTPDLTPEVLNVLEKLMLAQAQEIIIKKAIAGNKIQIFLKTSNYHYSLRIKEAYKKVKVILKRMQTVAE